MKLYVSEDYKIMSEAEALKYALENDYDEGYFQSWVNNRYSPMDVLCEKITLEDLEEEYLRFIDIEESGVHSATISDDALAELIADYLKVK